MEVRLLGPLAVVRGDRDVVLPQPKIRALLAYLALRANELVPADAIVDAVWGETPPRTVGASLQNHVSRLRKELGAEALTSQAGGYTLRLDRDRVDVHRFERLLGAARRAEGEERADKLGAALELWRGPALADLVFEPFAQTEAPRLEELRLTALEDRVDAELGLGHGADLVGELEALAAEHPLRERLRGQLMLALYRAGRQADALAAYRDARRTLIDELGIEPSPALRELEAAILRQDEALQPGGGAPRRSPTEWRRKRVTVLFAETAAAGARVDPEAARELVDAALAELRAVAAAHGGTVQEAAGDAAIAVFGVPTVHEDDALRAVRAAVELREAIADANARATGGDPRVELRIGIRTGEVLAANGDAAIGGDAVLVAKLLAEVAEAGEVLSGPATLSLVGDGVVAESVGPLDLRGRPEPLPAFRIVAVAPDAPAVARALDAPIVGRHTEVAELRQAFDAAVRERRCRLVTIAGEPGIGKTRLARELVVSLEDEARVVVGRCPAYGSGATYLPLAEVVARTVGGTSQEAIAAALPGDGQAGTVAGRVAALIGTAEGAGGGGEAFWAVRRFLEALARERPLLVVLDDLHWAEPTFLDLVEYLREWIAGAPVLVLCTARPELLEARPSWADTALRLDPLGELDAHVVIDNLTAGDLPPDVRARIVAAAEGNPLYVEQLLAYTRESSSVDLPPTLEALLASRLDRLEADTRGVLERAAVAGREFSRSAVEALSAPADAPAVRRQLATLEARGLVHPSRAIVPGEDAFRFHHALLRDAAYAAIPKATRAELHERLGDWLAERAAGAELVGSHLEEAFRLRSELGPVDRAARRLAADAGTYLGHAGIRAFKRGDNPATLNLLERATALLPEEDAFRRELLCELGLALRIAGELERAETVLADALATSATAGDRRLESRAGLELANVRLFSDPAEKAPELERSAAEAIPLFEALADDRSLGRAWLMLGTVRGSFSCQYAAGEEASARAVDHYARSGWPPAYAIGDVASWLVFGPQPVDEALERCASLLGRSAASPLAEAQVRLWTAVLEAMRGHVDLGRQLVDQARTSFAEFGHGVTSVRLCNEVAAKIEALGHDYAAAERLLRTACEFCRERNELAHLSTLAAELADVLYRLGRYREAGEWARLARAHAAPEDVSAEFWWRSALAKVLARQGSFGEADAMVRAAIAIVDATDGLNDQAKVRVDLAEVLRLAGRQAEAAAALEQALGLYERRGNAVAAEATRALIGELVAA